jgi:hypothetical protein
VIIGRCVRLRMAYGAETCSSLIRFMNCISLTAFVDRCTDCKDNLVIRSFDFLCARFYTVGSR